MNYSAKLTKENSTKLYIITNTVYLAASIFYQVSTKDIPLISCIIMVNVTKRCCKD